MDRWNELIAGYVLGNLTAEEREELEQILAEHPQLNDRILQLRQTATLRGGLPENRIPAYTADQPVSPTIQATHAKGFVTKGAEGWTDGLSGGPSLVKWEVNSVNSRLTQDKHTRQERSQPDPSSQLPSKSNRRNRNRSDRDWGNACTRNSWQNPLLHNPLWWLLVLVTIGLGIDNVRVRRSLTRMKDKTTYTHMGERPPTLWEDPYNNRWETQ